MDEHNEAMLKMYLENIIASDVAYNEYEAEENVRFMWDAISGLIRVMIGMDPLFQEVYSHLVHAGSFYEGLRITSANEFDLQMVLTFPFPPESFTISLPRRDSPYVTYKLKQSPRQILKQNGKWVQPYKKLTKFFDKDWFLSSDEVQKWIHGLMDEARNSDEFTYPRTVSDMNRRIQPSSCPAFTMEITGEDTGRTIDVDLVPVLNTCCTKIPRKMHKSKRFRQLLRDEANVQWFLVPKPSDPDRFIDPTSQVLWRSAFPRAEKQLLSETGCLKDVIRLFKRLRDLNGNWTDPIFSYVLKSFFMREFDADPDLDYWSEENLGEAFFESLERFQDAMERYYIPDYFNPKANMIAGKNTRTIDNIAGRVRNIISDLKENPYNICDIFKSYY